MNRLRPESLVLASLLAILPCLLNCGHAPRPQAVSPMDSPQTHYDVGMKKLDAGDAPAARTEFARAVELDPKFSPGYGGMAVVAALGGDAEGAAENLQRAKKEARSDPEKIIYHTAAVRAETALQSEDWLDHSRTHYEKGVTLAGSHADLTYFYGVANEKAREYDTAMSMYRAVIDLEDGRAGEADRRWQGIQRTLRAQPGSSYGREMARKESINRGELSMLLLEELDLEKTFEAPAVPGSREAIEIPYDVQDHILRTGIMKVLGWHLRGLDVADHLFHPDRPVTRGEFALLLEDLVIQMSGDRELATRYIHEGASPFGDVGNSSPYYNAVTVVTSRGLLDPQSPAMFDLDGSVRGSDVLLALRKLREHQY